jgi:hypothetical protein
VLRYQRSPSVPLLQTTYIVQAELLDFVAEVRPGLTEACFAEPLGAAGTSHTTQCSGQQSSPLLSPPRDKVASLGLVGLITESGGTLGSRLIACTGQEEHGARELSAVFQHS